MVTNRALTVVPRTGELDVLTLADHFIKSGFFKDVTDISKAVVKIMYGAELGIGPVQSMVGVNVIGGKPAPSAGLMATLIKRSGRYTYRTLEHTAERCALEFLEDGQVVGVAEFTRAEAEAAGLPGRNQNWKTYPKDMLFARAISRGARYFCADVFGGSVYVPEELEDARVVEHVGRPVNIVTGEVVEPGSPAPKPATERPAQLIKALADWHEEDQRARANGIEPAERDIDTATIEELRESSTRLFKLRAAAEEAGWPGLIAYALDAGMEVERLPELIGQKAFNARVEDLALRVAAKKEGLAAVGEEGPAPAAIFGDGETEEESI